MHLSGELQFCGQRSGFSDQPGSAGHMASCPCLLNPWPKGQLVVDSVFIECMIRTEFDQYICVYETIAWI